MPTCSHKFGHVVVACAVTDWSNIGHHKIAGKKLLKIITVIAVSGYDYRSLIVGGYQQVPGTKRYVAQASLDDVIASVNGV